MNQKIPIAVAVNILLLLNIYFLLQLINTSPEVDPPFRIRFVFFLGVCIFIFLSMIVMVFLSRIYSYIILLFINCLMIVAALTTCQYLVQPLESGNYYSYHASDGPLQHSQLGYLDVYFIVYTYAIIGFILTGFYILMTQIFIRWEEYLINKGIDQCLVNIKDECNLEEIQCAICLEEAKSNYVGYVQIKNCKHIFHRKCLIGWIIHHSTCPLCRKNMFQEEIEEERPEQIIQRNILEYLQRASEERQRSMSIEQRYSRQSSQSQQQRSERQPRMVSELINSNQSNYSRMESRISSRS